MVVIVLIIIICGTKVIIWNEHTPERMLGNEMAALLFWTIQLTAVEELNIDPTGLALLSKTEWKFEIKLCFLINGSYPHGSKHSSQIS